MSDQAKNVIQQQGNVEAFELSELTDNVQCMHYHQCQLGTRHRGAKEALRQAAVRPLASSAFLTVKGKH